MWMSPALGRHARKQSARCEKQWNCTSKTHRRRTSLSSPKRKSVRSSFMPKRLGSLEIIRVLEAHGFTFVSQRGSHAKYRDRAGHTAIVPHPNREVPIGTT